ncbi:exo-alpha-sialidase [Isoalcanivorax beigongshangi]|uniref:Exo-alpha-sialidase n=1 Tax=Isoalcanivorax beigongshangi TaxID=3238810 RepID=A0ABV4AES9_9GAMM
MGQGNFWKHWGIGALLVAGFFCGLPMHVWQPLPLYQPDPVAALTPQPGDHWQLSFASDGDTLQTHASSLVELPDGRLRGFWFAGSREGAADVSIHSAVFDPNSGEWGPEHVLLTREQVSQGLGRHVRKLGNVVPTVDADGRLRLYMVVVSFGGWGASRLAVAESDGDGSQWRISDGLVTSPFLNLSTLVKAPPIRYADGTIGLPVYHEFIGKYGEVLRLDEYNRILSRSRIGKLRESLQPLVLVDSPQQAVSFLRNARNSRPGILWRSDTDDGGESWTPLFDGQLPNPGSAVGGVSLGDGHWLLVVNNNAVERDDLYIMETRDRGQSWSSLQAVHDDAGLRDDDIDADSFRALVIDRLSRFRAGPVTGEQYQRVLTATEHNNCRHDGCRSQFDYPYVVRASNGDVHILYSWKKTLIAHAWWRADGQDPLASAARVAHRSQP